MFLKLLAAPLFAFSSTAALAAPCSDFEAEVFLLADQAATFQQSQRFKDYGWSNAGPTNGWLDRWAAVRDEDNELHLNFMRKYDFLPGNLYAVADAYRTDDYDSFYEGVESDITSANRCEY